MLRISVLLGWLLVNQPPMQAGSVDSADTLRPGQNERPSKPKVIVETDQRFFYFKDAGQPLLQNPVNVWGARAGLLLPSNIKTGLGYYFTSQPINEPWGEYLVSYRRLHYVSAYIEPYFFRRRFWELSALIEVGLGTARYQLLHTDTKESEQYRTVAVPLSAGLSISTKFPPVFGIKPLRWFGVNFMAGYRYTLHERVPVGPSTLNGVYYSVSPAVFLDRIYEDIGSWRKSRKRAEKR